MFLFNSFTLLFLKITPGIIPDSFNYLLFWHILLMPYSLHSTTNKNSIRSISAINPIAMENTDKKDSKQSYIAQIIHLVLLMKRTRQIHDSSTVVAAVGK